MIHSYQTNLFLHQYQTSVYRCRTLQKEISDHGYNHVDATVL